MGAAVDRRHVIRLRLGDSLDLLRSMEEGSVGAVITDPPYGLEFMGRDWDAPWKEVAGEADEEAPQPLQQSRLFQVWSTRWLQECHRVLVSGGLIKVFGATRMYHRMALAMQEVGFDLAPGHCIEAWMTSTGFPKYLDTSKAIDQQLGRTGDRPVLGYVRGVTAEDSLGYGGMARGVVGAKQTATMIPLTGPATPEAAEFDGYATALKPCWEPFLVGVRR